MTFLNGRFLPVKAILICVGLLTVPQKLYAGPLVVGYSTAAFYVMTRPEIARAQDLKGTRIGVTRLGSSSDFAIREYLKKNQLQAGRDVNII
jgi:ABC-type nitrate/sulfonate/bicarbonate transport system substrate-binding protein